MKINSDEHVEGKLTHIVNASNIILKCCAVPTFSLASLHSLISLRFTTTTYFKQRTRRCADNDFTLKVTVP